MINMIDLEQMKIVVNGIDVEITDVSSIDENIELNFFINDGQVTREMKERINAEVEDNSDLLIDLLTERGMIPH